MADSPKQAPGKGAALTAESRQRLRVLVHDLRSVLSVISLDCEILTTQAAKRGDVAAQKKLATMQEAAEQLRQLAHEITEVVG